MPRALLLAAAPLLSQATLSSTWAKVSIKNIAPEAGTCFTPLWFGVHDGRFDVYNTGEPLAPEFVPLVEDGNAAEASNLFNNADGAVVDGLVGTRPLCTGETAELEVDIVAQTGVPLYFSYAVMFVPSNDAWAGNGDPMAYELINADGEFQPLSITVMGTDVLDAGSEENDEIPENTAFFGQTVPGSGVDTVDGVVDMHPGFNPVESGGILDDPRFANADFKAGGYEMLSITVTIPDDGKTDDMGNTVACTEMEQMHEAENACIEAHGCTDCEDVDFGDDCAANKKEHCAEIKCCPACETEIRAMFGCEHGNECGDDLGTCEEEEDGHGMGDTASSGAVASMTFRTVGALLGVSALLRYM